MEILVFLLDGVRFGLRSGCVREVVRAVAVTRLPRAPAVVEGVIDARGRTVPVLDVRERFGLPGKEPDPADHMVLAEASGRIVAIRVDRAAELRSVEPAAIDAAERIVRGTDWVAGVARLPDGLVLIHDLATFLSQAETEALEAALPAAGARGGAA